MRGAVALGLITAAASWAQAPEEAAEPTRTRITDINQMWVMTAEERLQEYPARIEGRFCAVLRKPYELADLRETIARAGGLEVGG